MFATAVKAGQMSIEQLSPQTKDAVRALLAQQGYSGTKSIKRLVMQYQREDKIRAADRVQEMITAGYAPYKPQQSVYSTVLRLHLDGCESGEYPTASKTAQSVVGDKAPKLLAKSLKRFLRKALQENKEHPGMKRISALVSNSTITAAVSGTVSSCLGTLADTHKTALLFEEERKARLQEQAQQRQRMEALRAELASVREEVAQAKEDAARANARIDEAGRWKGEAVQLYRAGKSYSGIAKIVGKGKSTVNDYIRSLITAGKLEAELR